MKYIKKFKGFLKNYYTSKTFFHLFYVCVLPLHFWYFIAAFRDFGWVALRTNVWDAVGLLSYSSLAALAESSAIFLIAVLLTLITPPNWIPTKRFAFIGVLVLVILFWGIFVQVYALYDFKISSRLVSFIIYFNHPARVIWGIFGGVAVVTTIIPVLLVLRYSKIEKSVLSFFEQISVLSILYLVFDFVSIIIIIIRNVVI